MPANVTPDPLVIQPDDDLLERRSDLRRAARQLAGIYANGEFATDDALKAIGEGLYNALALDGALDAARKRAGAQILPLRIETDRADIQQLPWETLHHPDFGFFGLHDGFTLSRGAPATAVDLPAPESGPLKVLLFTSLPDDLGETGRLDIEEEQAQVLAALTPLIADGRVLLEMPDDGRFATLTHFLKSFQPHLVFLSGHGKYVNEPFQETDPFAIFLCENDHGGSAPVHESRLADAFLGSRARCVVLSACESGMTASDALTTGLMGSLHGAGLPHVIGMRESVLDRAGTLFARAFIDAVARQERVDVALQAGRQAITTPLADSPWLAFDSSGVAEQSLGQWSLPVLLSRDPGAPLIDWNFTPEPPPHRLPSETLSTITLPPRFIGRRSELRAVKSRLRRNQLTQLLITGPGGQGKTALAGKLAQDLTRRGYQVLAYSARPEHSWLDFEMEVELLLNADNAARYNRVLAKVTDEADKARWLLKLLCQQSGGKVLLFFDNLESVQDEKTQALTYARLAAWIAAARSLAAQGLIVLLTSRWRLPGWPDADQLSLARANYGDFLQMARPQLPLHLLQRRDWLRQVYDTLHGNGRGLTFFAAAVKEMDRDDEAAFLASLEEAEAQTQTDMALAAIVAQLDADARALLHRLRVYSAPVPLEGVVKIGLDLPAPEAHLHRLLAVSVYDSLKVHKRSD